MELYTGMRRGEVRFLKWEDLDFQRGFLAIRNPKGGEDQRISLSDATRELLTGGEEGGGGKAHDPAVLFLDSVRQWRIIRLWSSCASGVPEE